MANKEKQYHVYYRSTKERIPVSKKFFNDYYQGINAYRKKQQEDRRCVCPPKQELMCDMDCLTCPHICAGDTLSLDFKPENDEGNSKYRLDDITDSNLDVHSIIEDCELFEALYQRLEELDPEGQRICQLIMAGKSEPAAAAEMGITLSAFKLRWEAMKSLFAESLKNYI